MPELKQGMRRGAPLQRRTPLKAKKPLQAKTPTVPKQQGRTARKTSRHVGEKNARALVAARSNGVCEVRIPLVCLGRATNWHHRKPRSQGGRWTASNGLHVCGSGSHGCHGALTNTNGRRAEFEAAGWLLRQHQDPLQVPVHLALWGPVVLDDCGGCEPALALKPATDRRSHDD